MGNGRRRAHSGVRSDMIILHFSRLSLILLKFFHNPRSICHDYNDRDTQCRSDD